MHTRLATGLDWIGRRYTHAFGSDEIDKGPMASILPQLRRQAAARQGEPSPRAPETGTPGVRRAVFLDRDGTLTEPRHYPSHPDDLILQPGIGAPLSALQRQGFALVVVTNQSGVARGLFDLATLDAMHHRLRTLLGRHGVVLDGIYACPHHPEATVPRFRRVCSCRKPAPGMLHHAARELGLDIKRSWMIGDSACDITAGQRAGTRTLLVGRDPFGDMKTMTTAQALHYVLHSERGNAQHPLAWA